MPQPDSKKIVEFRRLVWAYYRRHRRAMPWRRTHDPYRILVSEFMLQQTQVERVLKSYSSFLKKFPTVQAVARAPLHAVLDAWQGLGYNRRAKFLRAAAQAIVVRHGGEVPQTEAELIVLPGIGRNTAGAIRAFAFDEPAVFIETNIRRVYIHHFFPRRASVDDAVLLPLVERTLPRRRPREWYYALMDYGAALGRDRALINPNRRAKTYRRQSAYAGSIREARATILKYLLAHGALRLTTGVRATNLPESRFANAVDALTKEGFIKLRQGTLRLE